jgi:hypothetical protein
MSETKMVARVIGIKVIYNKYMEPESSVYFEREIYCGRWLYYSFLIQTCTPDTFDEVVNHACETAIEYLNNKYR